MFQIINNIIKFSKNDYSANKIRFVIEIICGFLYITNAIILAVTTPFPPMLIIYIGWVVGAIGMIYCSWSRKSFGLMLIYISYFTIDSFGLIRTIL